MAAKAGNILVNDVSVKSNYKIKPGDIISIVMSYPRREVELIPENIPLRFIYQDDDLVVIDKEPGMVVHPGHGNFNGTLVNALAYHLKGTPLFEEGEERPGLVHRIDKNTSGLIVVAKTELALNRLAKQFFDRTTQREYVALVWGTPDPEKGTIVGNIGRHKNDRIKMAVYPPDSEEGKHAVTHYEVLERFSYVSLVKCKLETGRTHQIRAHFEHIKHPLFNDERYGGDRILKGTTFTKYKQFIMNCFNTLPRHALHARTLGFTHPTTGEQMFFESPIPEDMQTTIEKWRKYIMNRESEEE